MLSDYCEEVFFLKRVSSQGLKMMQESKLILINNKAIDYLPLKLN